ncbi:MAG: GNAT family N-acetyltransferase [Alphaproteobacteria bacterium]|nr:GNAT family N-acetyltransferase [Alphaproteobacteria bacterium]MBU0796292.1 GNAT family N-acetyltransferase [Alphaproteobacteria bacterium]MBU0889191.1 GNAT family N-acetyltransferase [Alphaproteobacteria bacterium]MBU1812225.1 GNAT family N-acetyltransferase [Alphaproteobacteria bacterium]MBU2089811.1 GNAT family N-acetyltransferase [Alphaproteobacteria bacterium]
MVSEIVILGGASVEGPVTAEALDGFLARHADSSMFLRSNLRRGGLVDGDDPFQGLYAVSLASDGIAGVATHYWNGMVALQAPDDAAALAVAVVGASGRPVKGFMGPRAQVVAARTALGLDERAARLDSKERLFALDLAEMLVPDPLNRGLVTCRPPQESEMNLMIEWRIAYAIDQLGDRDTPALRRQAKEDIARFCAENNNWVLLREDRPVAYAAFNATLPDMAQIGGVWTPPLLRGNGFARYCVAGALLEAREKGVARAVLFTGRSNWPSVRAYETLGFVDVGDYSLVLFEQENS